MTQVRQPACDACPLNKQRKVYGSGPLTAKVLVVLEAPGTQEEVKGEPLMGATGWRFNALMRGAGIAREDVRIENALQCKVKPTSAKGRKALQHCGPSLQDVTQAMPNLEAIFAFGDAALQEVSGWRASVLAKKVALATNKSLLKKHDSALKRTAKQQASYIKKHTAWYARQVKWEAKAARAAGKGRALKTKPPVEPPLPPLTPLPPAMVPVPSIVGWQGVGKMRGSALRWPHDPKVWLFPLLHPAVTFAHRSPDLLPLLALDIRKAARVWRGDLRVLDPQWRTCTTALDLTDWFNQCPPGRIALDIEWSRTCQELVCIGIGRGEHYALIPFITKEGWRLSHQQRQDVMAVLQAEFDNPTRHWGGHYACAYDSRKLHELGMNFMPTWDSLYAFHICFADLGSQRDESSVEQTGKNTKGGKPTGYDLGFVSTVLTPLPHHKGVVTHDKDALDADTPELHKYCIGDVCRSWLCIEAMAPELDRSNGWSLLSRDMSTAMRAEAMSIVGTPVLESDRAAHERMWTAELAIQESRAPFKLRSTLQLAKRLEQDGIQVRWNRQTGKPKLDGKIVSALYAKYPGNVYLKAVVAARTAQKEIDAYVAMKPGRDGQAHFNWKVHGTSGPRWSSTPNAQNLTKEQRKVIG